MTVEVPDAKAVIWTRPDDFEYDQADPKKGLLGMRAGGFIIGLADGSVRFLPSSIRSETLGALFTRDGGEPIDWNGLRTPVAMTGSELHQSLRPSAATQGMAAGSKPRGR